MQDTDDLIFRGKENKSFSALDLPVKELKDRFLKEYASIKPNKEGKIIYIKAEPFKFGMHDGVEVLKDKTIRPYVLSLIDGKERKVLVSEKFMIIYYAGFKFVMRKDVFKTLYRRI